LIRLVRFSIGITFIRDLPSIEKAAPAWCWLSINACLVLILKEKQNEYIRKHCAAAKVVYGLSVSNFCGRLSWV
jgi:hypothetical protein